MKKQSFTKTESLLGWALEQNIAKQEQQLKEDEALASAMGFQPDGHKRDIQTIIRKHRIQKFTKCFAHTAAVLIGAIVLSLVGTSVIVEGFWHDVLNWMEESGIIKIQYSNPMQPTLTLNGFRIHYLPEQFELEYQTDTLMRFGNGQNGVLVIKIDTLQTQAVADPDATYQQVQISDGLDGFYKYKDGQGTLIFYLNDRYIQITGTVAEAELYKIANRLEKVETP